MQIYLDHRSEETGRLVKMIQAGSVAATACQLCQVLFFVELTFSLAFTFSRQVRDLKGFNITEVLWNPAAMKRSVAAFGKPSQRFFNV